MEPKVSVIIPVYNVEKYLRQCLDSVLGQTLAELEVICVDDGSTDGSPEILREYAGRDGRVKVLTQENQYAGVARNNGMAAAAGKYMIFLDSDDFIEPEMLEKLYLRGEETKADIVLCGGRRYDTVTGEYTDMPGYLHTEWIEGREVFSRGELPDRILTVSNPAPWTKLFRSRFVRGSGLRFQALSNSNDLYFTMMSMCLAARITYVPEALVNYRVGMTGNTQRRKAREPLCFIDAYERLYDELQARGIYEEVRRSYIALTVSGCAFNLDTLRAPEALAPVYDRLVNEFFPRTGLLEHPDDDYDNLRNAERLRGTGYILECRERLALREKRAGGAGEIPAEGGPAVSVIIPIYNMEKYLSACLDSITGQTLADIEILCVNDGSTDGSLAIAEEYAGRDGRIVIVSQENGGLSVARNTGVSHSRGKYLYFMDSDDLLEQNALKALYERAERDGLDIVYFDGTSFADDGVADEQVEAYRSYYLRSNAYEGVFTGEELFARMSENGEYRSSACLQMTRRQYFLDQGLWFIPGVIHEDNAYSFRSILNAKRAGYIGEAFFHRRVRPFSIMSSQYSYKNVIGYFVCYLDMSDALCRSGITGEARRTATELLYRILHNARNIYREIPAPQRYAYLGLTQEEQILFRLHVLESPQGTDEIYAIRERLQRTYDEKSEINAKLQQTYREKSELNAKLQQTYGEKSELTAKLKKTYEEKSELNAKLQRTYGEKSELNAKLKKTYAEKAERGVIIREQEERIGGLEGDVASLRQDKSALEEELAAIRASASYRLGRAVTWPARKLRGL